MSSQNTTHVTDTLAMNTPNATTAEVVQSANVMMDMWGAESIAKVCFVPNKPFSYSFSKKICDRNYQTSVIISGCSDYFWMRFTLHFLNKTSTD